MSEFTPSEAIIREQYILSQERIAETPEFLIATRDHVRGAEFDRFVASIRNAALDEAAEVAKTYYPDPHYPDENCLDCEMVTEIASAIRALKEEKK